MAHHTFEQTSSDFQPSADEDGPTLIEQATVLARRWRLIVALTVGAGAAAIGVSYLLPPTYTASTTFLPPQQQQSLTSSALATLGPLAGLAGAAAGIKSPAEQYVSLLQSVNVGDRIIDKFKLQEVYQAKLRSSARQELAENVRFSLGKKDGLISIAVDDESPQRAADIANSYVEELRRLTAELALTEAQQRRAFFEQQLAETRVKLTGAQQALQSSGFSAETLTAEPKAAAETYAKLKAEHTAAEVKLQTLRSYLSDEAVEIKQALSNIAGLQRQLDSLASRRPANSEAESGYIGKYRDFKYQEALFDLFSRQFELAKLDESREGALIQVVDAAAPPDRRSKPRRVRLGLAFGALGFLLICGGLLLIDSLRRGHQDPVSAQRWREFLGAFKG
ncbi:Wzz/FepE/Etk N-terminal domain-containing protein [Roseateles toxinivorans]|uniref:Subunit length determinant protein n=1 Tax=Roseateles toxinivorans TaxID=270368 RepID=A0A4R6QP93_9BURK|nr:Wzz/FepE/Etk N-terminal domain-containing protein [Roseateles toxinivorans]TDP71438.1 subunit length determinant protein [Roseateles toxinivorans]